MKHQPFEAIITWQSIKIKVTYGELFSNPNLPFKHLTVTAIEPEKARLPMTETGFKSHYITDEDLENYASPADYVKAWLEKTSQSSEWIAYAQSLQQMDLF